MRYFAGSALLCECNPMESPDQKHSVVGFMTIVAMGRLVMSDENYLVIIFLILLYYFFFL